MNIVKQTAGLAAALVVVSVLSGVGIARATDLIISGSTMLFPLDQVWANAYMKSHPGVHVSVASTGSGFGIYNAANGNITIGATDAYLSKDLLKRYGSLVSIPVAFDDTQVIYNIPGIKKFRLIRMDGPTLSRIYMGKIKFWDDKAIREINPDVRFPHQRIKVIHRADASGTTFVFTDYLSQTSKEWYGAIGRDRSPSWPVGSGYNGSDAVVAAVKATPGAIGYVGLVWINKYHLSSMALKNLDGYYVVGSVKTIQNAGKAALHDPSFPDDFNRTIVWNLHGKEIYPDANFEFWMVSTDLPGSTMLEVRKMIIWALTKGQKERYTVKTGFAPLPFAPLKPRLNKILNRILPGNTLKIESGG